jgi:hypothetical protein
MNRIQIAVCGAVSYFLTSFMCNWIYHTVIYPISKGEVKKREDFIAAMVIGGIFILFDAVVRAIPVFLLGLLTPPYLANYYTAQSLAIFAALSGLLTSVVLIIFKYNYDRYLDYVQNGFIALMPIGIASIMLFWLVTLAFMFIRTN